MILSPDRSIYGKLIEDLSNSYSMGTYHYPYMCTNMHNTIVHWRNRAACYGLRAPPGDVVFAQDNNYSLTSGKMHANGGQKELMELSKDSCFKFQEFGHFANKCLNRDKIGKTHANFITKKRPTAT